MLDTRKTGNGRATAADILDRYKLEQAGAELHSEATKKLVDGNDDDEAEVS